MNTRSIFMYATQEDAQTPLRQGTKNLCRVAVDEEASRQGVVPGPGGGLTGFSLREFDLSYHNKETLLFTIDPYFGNLNWGSIVQ